MSALFCTLVAAGSPATISPGDRSFITQALAAGETEIRSAQAELQSSNAGVRAFAQQMIHDHTAMNAQLSTVANERGVPVGNPSVTSPAPAATPLSAQTYARHEVRDHENAIALFRKEATQGNDAQIRKIAALGSKILRGHLAMAQALVRR